MKLRSSNGALSIEGRIERIPKAFPGGLDEKTDQPSKTGKLERARNQQQFLAMLISLFLSLLISIPQLTFLDQSA